MSTCAGKTPPVDQGRPLHPQQNVGVELARRNDYSSTHPDRRCPRAREGTSGLDLGRSATPQQNAGVELRPTRCRGSRGRRPGCRRLHSAAAAVWTHCAMLSRSIVLAVIAGIASLGAQHSPTLAQPAARVIAGYLFVGNAPADVSDVDASRLTHINYAFANLRDGEVVGGLRVGRGELPAPAPSCDSAIHTCACWWRSAAGPGRVRSPTWRSRRRSRARFVESAVEFVRRHDLDGFRRRLGVPRGSARASAIPIGRRTRKTSPPSWRNCAPPSTRRGRRARAQIPPHVRGGRTCTRFLVKTEIGTRW